MALPKNAIPSQLIQREILKMISQHQTKIFSLGTMAFGAKQFSVVEIILYTVGCLAELVASSHQMLVAPSPVAIIKYISRHCQLSLGELHRWLRTRSSDPRLRHTCYSLNHNELPHEHRAFTLLSIVCVPQSSSKEPYI